MRKHLKAAQQGLGTTRELYQSGKLHSRIILQLRMMAALSLIALGLIIYEIIIGNISWLLAVSIGLPSVLVGLGFSRIYRMDWSEEEELLVLRKMDWTSGLILAVYILSRITLRPLLTGLHVSASLILAITFVTLFGIMVGRFIGLTRIIHRTYNERE